MPTGKKTLSDFRTDWIKLVDKALIDYKSLSNSERIWFNIQVLIGDVGNGWFISHYYNSGAAHNKETIEDLITVGFPDIASLLIHLNTLFPGEQPSISLEERNDIISSWPDGAYDELFETSDKQFYEKEEELEEKLTEHVEKLMAN